MNHKRQQVIAGNEISRVERYSLGGYEQKVALDGKDKKKPIIVTLHGGPGMPIPFSVGARGLFPQFTDQFIMVYWDQLGCGSNNYPIDDNFTIDNYVEMTLDLVKELKKQFPDNLLLLFGNSWGSILAAKAAAKIPELIDGVMIYGQVLKKLFFNEEVYEALHKANLPRKVRKQLTSLQSVSNHTFKELINISTFMRKYTEGYQIKSNEKMPIGMIMKGVLQSPDYKMKDFIALIKNGFMNENRVWHELLQVDLSEELCNMKIPYYILQGQKDIVTSTNTIASFVEQCGNENLKVKIIENNAHIPGISGMDAVFAQYLELIKQVS